MDKIGRTSATPSSSDRAALLSPQVTDGRYFFLELAPSRAAGVTLAIGGRERCRPDYHVRRANYAFFGVEFVADGGGAVSLDGRSRAISAGSAYAYGPKTAVEITTDPVRPMVKYFLCLSGGGVAARLKRARLPVGKVTQLSAPGEVRSVFEDLIREGQWHGPLTREVCASLGELLLLKIESSSRAASDAAGPTRANFLRCKSLIDANAERMLSLEDIAEAAGFDVSTVCRLFRRHQGTSPYQYLLRRKMNLAAEFLLESGGLVKEAAQRVGFDDPYHFSRVFKSVHGVAPRDVLEYRRAPGAARVAAARRRSRRQPPS